MSCDIRSYGFLFFNIYFVPNSCNSKHLTISFWYLRVWLCKISTEHGSSPPLHKPPNTHAHPLTCSHTQRKGGIVEKNFHAEKCLMKQCSRLLCLGKIWAFSAVSWNPCYKNVTQVWDGMHLPYSSLAFLFFWLYFFPISLTLVWISELGI